MAHYTKLTRSQQQQIDELERPYRQILYAEKLAHLSEEAQQAHRTPKEKRTVEMENQIQETAEQLKITDTELGQAMSPADRVRHKVLREELKRTPKPPPLPLAMALQESNGAPARTFVLFRGDYNNPREEVQPGFPTILRHPRESDALPRSASSLPNDRRDLALWLANANNPLTARVMVNRIWQHHFGRGLAPAPSDFGTRGVSPAHPELLDWLAGEFIEHGWSLKAMHKLILLSATYQQSSQATPEAFTRDPENQLISRQNRSRLEGEVIRDSLLAISGQLNRQMGGPSVFPPVSPDIIKTSKNWVVSPNAADHARRSLYVFVRRNLRFPFLEVFDAPDNNLSCPERARSTTAPQALTLLNSAEVLTAAKATAQRLAREAKSTEDRITLAFRLTLGRSPSPEERHMAQQFLRETEGKAPPTASSSLLFSFAEFSRALFNLNAFLYVD
jgi:hypothetical protein